MAKEPKQSAAPKKKQKEVEVTELIIQRFEKAYIQIAIIGVTPFVCNRQSEKTKRELLLPAIKMNPNMRQHFLKHDPMEEYRSSPYLCTLPGSPTHIMMKTGAFKSSACDSAVDSIELKAAQVRRLVSATPFYTHIWGVPEMWITDVRQGGINRTPDMRTRAIIKEWCAIINFSYIKPHMNEQKLINLISNGGLTRGVGDGRVEKGALDFGQYQIISHNDPKFKRIQKLGGYAQQVKAMKAPGFFDEETQQLYHWFVDELKKRAKDGNIQKSKHTPAAMEVENGQDEAYVN